MSELLIVNFDLVWSVHTHGGKKDDRILLVLRNKSFGDIASLSIS